MTAGLTLALAVLAAVLTGYGTWTLAGLNRERPVRRQPDDDRNLELWLLGNPISPGTLRVLAWIACAVSVVIGMVATGNVVCAILLGSIGYTVPGSVLAALAASTWARADDQAHSLATVLQFALPVEGNPHTALAHVLPDLGQPLRGWMERVVAGEAAGVPLEDGLATLADRLRHRELRLLADILLADRRAAPSHALISELLPEWEARTKAASERASLLGSGQILTGLFTWGPLAVFLLVDGLTPAGQVFHATLAGQAIAALGMAVLTFTVHIARVNLARQRTLATY